MIHDSHIRLIIRHLVANHQAYDIKRLASKKRHDSHIRHFPNMLHTPKSDFLAKYCIFGECANDGYFWMESPINKAFHDSPNSGESWCECANHAHGGQPC